MGMTTSQEHVLPLLEAQGLASEVMREFRAGTFGRVTQVQTTAAAKARASVGLSQARFAQLLGVSLRTLQEWEQGRREPTGAAQTLLRVATQSPEALLSLVA